MASQLSRIRRVIQFGICVLCFVLAGSWFPGSSSAGDEPAKRKSSSSKTKSKKTITGLKESPDIDMVNGINEKLAAKWKANKVTPSARASDYEFIRRASLDIIGRIATTKEIASFFKDPSATRRALLIERLLKSKEYSQNWANIWTVWLLTRNGETDRTTGIYHDQMRKWLQEQFAKPGMSHKELVTELLTATGKTSENGAVNYILAHLGDPIPGEKQTQEGKFTMIPITWRTTRLFLGLQTQCAQCHAHPFNKEMKQADFWGINAFFRQIDRKGMPMRNREAELELTDNTSLNSDGIIAYEERNGKVEAIKPKYLFEKRGNTPTDNRRQELAKYITGSPYFAKAYVNRMWAHFFGRGFTNPVDDFNEDNAPSHPELVDKLASEFVHYGYDPRRLIRWICNSEAYNQSSMANKTNDKAELEPLFSRMLLKAMTPEQLFESLMVATQAEMFENEAARKKLRDAWLKNLSTNFGDDEGNEVTFNGTVVQALMMMNGTDINQAIASEQKGTVAWAFFKLPDRDRLHYLYLSALNRPPTARESTKIYEIMRRAPVTAPTKRSGLAGYQDVFWALLNSNEFMLNH